MLKSFSVKKTLSLIIALVMICTMVTFIMPSAALAASSYYVDSVNGSDGNSGLSGSPWQTLDKVNSQTFVPGDKIYFKRGCSWTGTLMPQGSGNSTSVITIDAYGTGALPHISGGSFWSGWGYTGVMLANQNYWTIKNLDISCDYTSYDSTPLNVFGVFVCAFDYSNMTNITLSSLVIHDVNGNIDGGAYGGNTAGIFCFCSGSSDVNGAPAANAVPSKFNQLKVLNCEVSDVAGRGICLDSSWRYTTALTQYEAEGVDPNWVYTGSTKVLIKGNYVHDNGHCGIIICCANKAIIENNLVANCGNANTSFGYGPVAIWSMITFDPVLQFNEVYGTGSGCGNDGEAFNISRSNNCVYQYNYSHDNSLGFMLIDNGRNQEATAGQNNVARYNISQSDGGEKIFRLQDPQNTKIYNNTIYIPDGYQPTMIQMLDAGWGTLDLYVYNNIVYDLNSTSPSAIDSEVMPASYYVDYNCFYQANSLGFSYEPSQSNPINSAPSFAGAPAGSIADYLPPTSATLAAALTTANLRAVIGGYDLTGALAGVDLRGDSNFSGDFTNRTTTQGYAEAVTCNTDILGTAVGANGAVDAGCAEY